MKLSTTQKRRQAGLCPACGEPNNTIKHYCKDCTIIMRDRARARKDKYPNRCSRCRARDPEPPSAYCSPCQEASKIASSKYRNRIKHEVFKEYGPCVCCGNDNIRVLTLDHINGGGNNHLKEIEMPLVRWAHKNGCPDILQSLCASCHHIKTYYGQCLSSDHSPSSLETSSDPTC